ncbi:MAG TPA: hypothetical protein VGE24_12185, partial [Emticicia sp.]
EIANIVGDTVRQLPTTTVNAKYLTTVLDNSFLPNYYYVRVKSSSPEGATPYVLIRILPKPVVTMNWYSINEATTVQYKQKVRVRFRFDNTTSLRGFRMSDGTVMNYRNSTAPELFTNSDWEFYPEKDYYYTVDSLIANCGVIKDFDVIGSRFIKVEKGFSILGVKKSYCIGETVKLKIDSPVSFGINNSFTAKMYQFGSLIGSFPASIKNDSLVFTISPDNGFNPALGTVQMRIESSNPFMLSSVSEGYFLIYNKPELGILNSSFNITMPGEVNIPVNVKSQNPLFVTINDGQRDSTFKFDAGLNEYMFTNSSFNLFVKKNTTYHIKSISNSCGVGKLTSANNFNVSVSNTDEKKIYLIGGALKAICLKKTVPIYFNAGGKFDANNEFVVYVNYYPTRLEVGRGKSSPIMVTLPEPENFIYSSRSGYYLSIESTSPYFRSDNNLYLYLQSSDDRVNFGISQINFNWSFSINDYLQKEKAIELIKGDLFNQGFTAPYEPYIDIPYRFKVNNQWIDQSVKFNIAKDTTLYLQGFQSSCGFIESRDSIPIKMKKYRIAYSFSGDGWRCMGDIADLNFTIEGEKFTQPYDFDVKFIPVENTTIKNSAEILQKKGNTYRIRIPDMPYEKEATIEVTPKVGKEDFAKLYVGNYLYLNKVLNIKLTAEDGSDTLWRSSYNYKVPKVKFETLNSFNPDWYGYLNSDDNYRIEQKIAVVRSYNDFYNSSKLIELTRVSPINSCGFPKFSGKVYVKIC